MLFFFNFALPWAGMMNLSIVECNLALAHPEVSEGIERRYLSGRPTNKEKGC